MNDDAANIDSSLDATIVHQDIRNSVNAGSETLYSPDDDFDPRQAVTVLARKSDSEKYVVDKKIAEGGMGEVYRVYDRDLKRNNVIKVIRPEVGQNRQMFINFIEEARITGQLEHPNIIPVHSVGVIEDDKLYFSMKEIEGETLESVLEQIRDSKTDKYTIYSLLTLFRKVCDAIGFAHSKDIIHRDIKPENIMVGNYGEVLVVDWGLARDLKRPETEVTPDIPVESDRDPTVSALDATVYGRQGTQFGDIKGSPAFMSPEQAFGLADKLDKRTDIFLLGSTLYAIATLSAPYLGKDLREVVEKAEKCDFLPPAQRAPERELPVELCRIIQRAMELEQDDRYQSVEELVEDIDDLLAGQTASETCMFASGDLIIAEGDSGNEAYVILAGSVQVFKNVDGKVIPLVQLSEGDTFGEMALISGAPRSASVQAITDTQVVVITQELIHRGLDKLPPWMGNVIEALVDRLRTTNKNVHALLTGDNTYHILVQMEMAYLCWGQPRKDDQMTVVVLPASALINHVSRMLCIPDEPVTRVVSELLDYGLLQTYDDDQIFIPNLALIDRLLDKLRNIYSIDTEFAPLSQTTTIVASPNTIALHRSSKKQDGAELSLISEFESAPLLGCDNDGQVESRLDDIIATITR